MNENLNNTLLLLFLFPPGKKTTSHQAPYLLSHTHTQGFIIIYVYI